jgi:hypothetical protein
LEAIHDKNLATFAGTICAGIRSEKKYLTISPDIKINRVKSGQFKAIIKKKLIKK